MRLYIARHAKRLNVSVNSPISQAGYDMARAVGDWLRDDGAKLTPVVVTKLQRTHQTARAMLERLTSAPTPHLVECPGRLERKELAELLERLGREAEGDVLLVVHGGTQRHIEHEYGGAALQVPSDHRNAVFRLERIDGRWRVTGGWPGRQQKVG